MTKKIDMVLSYHVCSCHSCLLPSRCCSSTKIKIIHFLSFLFDSEMSSFQRKLKEGEVLRYKSGFLSKKWKECWAVLFSDSEFVWYEKKVTSFFSFRSYGFLSLKNKKTNICLNVITISDYQKYCNHH